MKKLNNKGMSLIELIISFSLVCVAIIYFFETLFITNKIFRTTKEDTKKYVDKAYVFNIIDYYVHDGEFIDYINGKAITSPTYVDCNIPDNNLKSASCFLDKKLGEFEELDDTFKWIKYTTLEEPNPNNIDDVTSHGIMYSYRFKMDGQEYYYYFATNVKTDTISD